MTVGDDGTFTYLWEWDKQSGDNYTGAQYGLTNESPTSAETIIDGTLVTTLPAGNMHFKVTVTDTYGNKITESAGGSVSK